MTGALLAVPGPEDAAVVEEARRLAAELADGGTDEQRGTTDAAGDAEGTDGEESGGRPEVIVVAFDGVTDPEDLPASEADEVVRLVPEDGTFTAGAAGVRGRAAALADVAADARAVLLPDTPDGADLAAATASRLRAGCVTDCLLRVREGDLLAGRPAYNGRAYAELSFDREPAVVSLDSEALGTPATPADRSPEVRTVEVAIDGADDGLRHLETVEVPESDLSKARRIVAGGRGLGDPDGFEVIEELADAAGAAVGASRPPSDDGWVAYDRQIGVTGKEIDVELYVPCAISGDPYHTRSVNADCLIPINSDPEARIFEFADVGIVGDVYEYGPALAAAIREATNGDDAVADVDADAGGAEVTE